jgi:hypothetical protein
METFERIAMVVADDTLGLNKRIPRLEVLTVRTPDDGGLDCDLSDLTINENLQNSLLIRVK